MKNEKLFFWVFVSLVFLVLVAGAIFLPDVWYVFSIAAIIATVLLIQIYKINKF